MLKKLILAAAMTALALSTGAARAEFPERTIENIFPWTAGEAMAISQIIAKAMGEELGVSIPVISTPGAAGTKAFQTALNKPADGYTIIDGYVAPLVLQPVLGNADWTYADSSRCTQPSQTPSRSAAVRTRRGGMTLKG
jgi:tripartite-type tricarboxylate transporter receptor subunit TctC